MKLNWLRKKEVSFPCGHRNKAVVALFLAPDSSCFKENHREETKKGAVAPSGLKNGLFSVYLLI